MYTMFDKPTDNMNISMRKLNEMEYNAQQEAYKEEDDRIKLAESAEELRMQERENYLTNYGESQRQNINKRNKFLQDAKTAFLSECLCKLYKDCSTPLLEQDKPIVKNLVNKFIIENDVNDLVRKFATENLLLSEFSRITTKYYNKVLESCCDEEETDVNDSTKAREFNIDSEIKDDFYKELVDVDTTDVSKLIKDRVADAMGEFVDTNVSNKLDYQDVIQAASDRMADPKNESFIDEIKDQTKLNINEMKSKRKKNVFHYMVESLSKKSIRDNVLGQRYVHEGSLSMDNVVNDVQVIYTMLEMVNTTNMIKVDQEYMKNYIDSLS